MSEGSIQRPVVVWLVVFVLLLGLGITVGVRCFDDMAMPGIGASAVHHTEAGQTMSAPTSESADQSHAVIKLAAGPLSVAGAALEEPMTMTPGMLLGICMALLGVVLLVVALSLGRRLTRVLPAVSPLVPCGLVPSLLRSPDLAQLGVLRT